MTRYTIPAELVPGLLDFYIQKLARDPALQDKIEFEIVFSSFDLSTQERSRALLEFGFSDAAVSTLVRSLKAFTNRVFTDFRGNVLTDLQSVHQLTRFSRSREVPFVKNEDPPRLVGQALRLLSFCRDFGVLPFSRLARLAFITLALWRSLVRAGVISEEALHRIIGGIRTVATRLDNDYRALRDGLLSSEVFFSRYGHLRPGTYSIQAPRLDACKELLCTQSDVEQRREEEVQENIGPLDLGTIDGALTTSGLSITSAELLRFTSMAIRWRERTKFEFTKLLSLAIEHLALAGELAGMSRAQMAMIELDEFEHAASCGRSFADSCRSLLPVINSRAAEREAFSRIALAPVLASPRDLTVVQYYTARPNFVTQKCVEGEVCAVGSGQVIPAQALAGRIVLLESADPGYDWIFGSGIVGLITKHGGVASHMAIRCSEFDVAGAIGVGEVLYGHAHTARRMRIDCVSRKVLMW